VRSIVRVTAAVAVVTVVRAYLHAEIMDARARKQWILWLFVYVKAAAAVVTDSRG
jgi:hypothetical protein